MSRAGTLSICDQAVAVRRYNANGRYLGTLGRRGAGPGEYRNVAGMTVLDDGRIVLHDFGNGCFNVYVPSGELLATWSIRPAIAERRPLHGDGSGGVFLHDRRIAGGETTRQEVLVQVSEHGERGDTSSIPFSEYRPDGLEIRTERRSIGALLPFAPSSEWSVTARGELVTMLGSRYAIDVRRHDGVSCALRATSSPYLSAPGNGPPIPEVKPPLRWLHTGADTTIWVRVSVPGRAIPEAERLPSVRS